jgi:hypothetical protein
MTIRSPYAVWLATAVFLLGSALTSTASAQDVMQLDLAFRDSLLRKSPSDGYTGRQEWPRPNEGLAQEQINPVQRHPRRHRHKT